MRREDSQVFLLKLFAFLRKDHNLKKDLLTSIECVDTLLKDKSSEILIKSLTYILNEN